MRKVQPNLGLTATSTLVSHLMQAVGLSGIVPAPAISDRKNDRCVKSPSCSSRIVEESDEPTLRRNRKTHAPCDALARSIFTPGPWVEETDTFLTKVPF